MKNSMQIALLHLEICLQSVVAAIVSLIFIKTFYCEERPVENSFHYVR